MLGSGPKISIRREEINSETCIAFMNEIMEEIQPLHHALVAPIPDEFRPRHIPEGSVFLVAEVQDDETAAPELVGSVALIPLAQGSANASGLPENVRVGEIKRMVVRPPFRRAGVAVKLLEAIEDIARTEMGLGLLALETWHMLTGAQRLYESSGWTRREVYGRYDARDSQCYDKWI
ncbi:hypothetical protein LTR85_009924 [Meristemomyces frigidus]|nr:hypothetical protein LTR85_009924 [Meristemomyces frigidus]